ATARTAGWTRRFWSVRLKSTIGRMLAGATPRGGSPGGPTHGRAARIGVALAAWLRRGTKRRLSRTDGAFVRRLARQADQTSTSAGSAGVRKGEGPLRYEDGRARHHDRRPRLAGEAPLPGPRPLFRAELGSRRGPPSLRHRRPGVPRLRERNRRHGARPPPSAGDRRDPRPGTTADRTDPR